MNSKYFRLSELISLYPQENNNARFYEFLKGSCEDNPDRVKAFSLIEQDLSELDDKSWFFLKNETKNLCVKKDKNRGHSKLFDRLNEARGYCFLKKLGCSNIKFITTEKNNKTPDLVGYLSTSQVLCEVKTISISDELINSRKNLLGRSAQNTLTKGMINKLKSTFDDAACQLNSYSTSPGTKKYIYLVIKFDDDLDYRNELNIETKNLFKVMNLDCVNLEIRNEDY